MSQSFTATFDGKFKCTVKVSDNPPEDGTSHIQQIEWEPDIPRNQVLKIIRPYIAWMNSVQTILATAWDKKILYMYQTSNTHWDVWSFEPNKRPKFIEHINGGALNVDGIGHRTDKYKP